MTTLAHEDRDLLRQAIGKLNEIDEREEAQERSLETFGSLLLRGRALTAKQRAWAAGVIAGHYVEPEPEYENLISSGRAPRGREVETPALLRRENLPLRPPRRPAEEP